MSMSTVYNGSVPCIGCGTNIGPAQAVYSDECRSCTKKRNAKKLKERMA